MAFPIIPVALSLAASGLLLSLSFLTIDITPDQEEPAEPMPIKITPTAEEIKDLTDAIQFLHSKELYWGPLKDVNKLAKQWLTTGSVPTDLQSLLTGEELQRLQIQLDPFLTSLPNKMAFKLWASRAI